MGNFGDAAKLSLTITITDTRNVPIGQWVLSNAWPDKLYETSADGSLFEVMTVVAEDVQRTK